MYKYQKNTYNSSVPGEMQSLSTRPHCLPYSLMYPVIVLLTLLLCDAKPLLRIPNNVTITAVFGFGDSIVDAGNNNYIETLIKSNFPPYGRDFLGGQATGRFTNGKLPADLLVEALGLKQYLPAYLDPNLETDDLLTGVNFASGGAGYDQLTSDLVSVISLPDQVKLFKEYKEKLKGEVGEARVNSIVRNSIFVVAAGSDDIANTYYTFSDRPSTYDVPSYTDLLVNSASKFFLELYEVGARHIGISGVPPIGCLPSQRTLAGGSQRQCSESHNHAAQMLNTKLIALKDFLNKQIPDLRVVYTDIYNPLLHLILNPLESGFRVADRGCCGTGMLEVAVLCNRFDVLTCNNVSEYVFWDSYHPTEKAYRIIAEEMSQQLVDCSYSNKPC